MRHVLITVVVLVMTTLHAQRVGAQQPGAESEPAARSIPEEDLNKTQHSVRIGGEEVRYTATAGTLLLKDEAGEPKAKAFFVAYTRNGMPGGRARPITFAYNGGPGSASIWLHMGALGPRRIQMAEDGFQPPPPTAWSRTSTRSLTSPT